ncbi:hypothetical protein MJ8_48930 [Mesorhizobium sp. J8]|nr:hypothetical protein MJ8_48930 [Mesorhizobium sp. J8]
MSKPAGAPMPSISIRKTEYDPATRVLSVWFVASGKRYEFERYRRKLTSRPIGVCQRPLLQRPHSKSRPLSTHCGLAVQFKRLMVCLELVPHNLANVFEIDDLAAGFAPMKSESCLDPGRICTVTGRCGPSSESFVKRRPPPPLWQWLGKRLGLMDRLGPLKTIHHFALLIGRAYMGNSSPSSPRCNHEPQA